MDIFGWTPPQSWSHDYGTAKSHKGDMVAKHLKCSRVITGVSAAIGSLEPRHK